MNRLLLLACLLLTAPVAYAQENPMLRFELLHPVTHSPEGWEQGIGRGSEGGFTKGTMQADSIIRQQGRYALSMASDGTGEKFVSAVHVINKKLNGRNITLTGYMKTDAVKGTAGLWMRIDGKTSALAFDNMGKRPVTGTTDWKKYEIELPYDKESAERICVGVLLVGSGKVWIDNFRIAIDDNDLDEAPAYTRTALPADLDTAHYSGSGISAIELTPEKTAQLANLGTLWGFIKYYHAGVQQGQFNMDARLLRVLPRILDAKTGAEANAVMEAWVDGFGKPAKCASCKKLSSFKEVAQKPDYGRLFDKRAFPASLMAKLEYIRDNRYSGKDAHYYIGMAPGVGNPEFRNEHNYSDQKYPDAGIRLLALYRYWNMIQYFFPYRHLIGEDWNSVLPDAIPEFCNAADTAAYQLACLRLIARIHDTHANLWQGATALQGVKGRYILPFQAAFVDDQLVVTGFYKDASGTDGALTRGDVIERIGGESVKALVKRYLPLTPASNYETQLRDMTSSNGFLLRSNSIEEKIQISRNGKKKDITLKRISLDGPLRIADDTLRHPVGGYRMLNDGIGYIYPANLRDESIESVRQTMQTARGIIIDLRCYPSAFMPFSYGEWLKPDASPFVYFTNGSTDMPGLFTKTGLISNGHQNRQAYRGKVVIIVNELTQSQAEYTTMAFQTIPGAVTIGSTTAGADGNVSSVTLPGGLGSWISGIDVLYPDGTETQRRGVRIDRVIRPTVRGIQAGKDELLEEAISIINTSQKAAGRK